MKAARFYDNHDLRVEDVDIPEPGASQVQLAIEWCGICGSDLHEYLIGLLTGFFGQVKVSRETRPARLHDRALCPGTLCCKPSFELTP